MSCSIYSETCIKQTLVTSSAEFRETRQRTLSGTAWRWGNEEEEEVEMIQQHCICSF